MNWVVVQTKTLHEKLVMRGLEEQVRYGVCNELWCPTYVRDIRHARHIEQRRMPLYPGYVFARVDLTRRHWIKILHTRGVKGVLGSPSVVPDWSIRLVKTVVIDEQLTPGEKVYVKTWDVSGLFQSSENGRVKVMLKFLGLDKEFEFSEMEVVREKDRPR